MLWSSFLQHLWLKILTITYQIYLHMINQDYSINRNTVHRNYYSANELQAEVYEDQNINFCHKMSGIENEHLTCNPETDYDFLRIEIQAQKNKLSYLIKN